MPTCPNCGTDNPDGFRFCGQCGTPLAETTPERLEALNDEFEGRFGARIGLRVGINTGEVLAGDAGGGEGFVSGDAVNVAARLEQTAGVGEVLLGELTYRLARQAITAERVEPLTLKGKAKPVPAYRLVAVAPDGAARVGHAGTALVGRDEELARERPLVVAIEDLHWAEQALVDLVEQLPALARGPILVVCLGRPEALDARPEWPGRVIRLEPLPDEDATLLIERLIGGAGLREDARERILEAAAGVPLFVEELLAILVEDGLVRQTPDGRWVPHGSLADFAIPPTIDALLAERLDRLEARQRTLLEDGAVEGQLFHLR